VGKYVELQDSYKSILESFIHAGAVNEVKVNVRTIHSEHIHAKNFESKLKGLNGILVAPGFGERGIEGKIKAVQYARENNIPFLGICLGMQMAVIEFSRNVLGYQDATSTEMKESTEHPVINLMENQKNITNKGGTMRLGSWDCELKGGSLVKEIYHGAKQITERHRHRYEFNNDYKKQIEKAGMIASGINKETGLVEIVEIPTHPWFIGVQYHPEYKSTVVNPHPLFVGFVKAALAHKN
jgi:CTP synthase